MDIDIGSDVDIAIGSGMDIDVTVAVRWRTSWTGASWFVAIVLVGEMGGPRANLFPGIIQVVVMDIDVSSDGYRTRIDFDMIPMDVDIGIDGYRTTIDFDIVPIDIDISSDGYRTIIGFDIMRIKQKIRSIGDPGTFSTVFTTTCCQV